MEMAEETCAPSEQKKPKCWVRKMHKKREKESKSLEGTSSMLDSKSHLAGPTSDLTHEEAQVGSEEDLLSAKGKNKKKSRKRKKEQQMIPVVSPECGDVLVKASSASSEELIVKKKKRRREQKEMPKMAGEVKTDCSNMLEEAPGSAVVDNTDPSNILAKAVGSTSQELIVARKKRRKKQKEKTTEVVNPDSSSMLKEASTSSLQELNVNNGPSGELSCLPMKREKKMLEKQQMITVTCPKCNHIFPGVPSVASVELSVKKKERKSRKKQKQKMAGVVNTDYSNMLAEAPVSTEVVNIDCSNMLAEAPVSTEVFNTDRSNVLAEAASSAEVVDPDCSNILLEAAGSELIVKKKKKRTKEKNTEVFSIHSEALASSLQEVKVNNGPSGESNCLPAKKEKKVPKMAVVVSTDFRNVPAEAPISTEAVDTDCSNILAKAPISAEFVNTDCSSMLAEAAGSAEVVDIDCGNILSEALGLTSQELIAKKKNKKKKKKKKKKTKEKITEVLNIDSEAQASSLPEVNVNNGSSGESNGLPAKKEEKVQKMAEAVSTDCSNVLAKAPVSTEAGNTDFSNMLAEAPISAEAVNTDHSSMLAEAADSAEVVDTDRSNILSEAVGSTCQEIVNKKKKKRRTKEKIAEVFNTDSEAQASSLEEVNVNDGPSSESNCLLAKEEKKVQKIAEVVNTDCNDTLAEAPVSTEIVNTDCGNMPTEAPISADAVNPDHNNILAEAAGSAEVVDADRSNILSEAAGSTSQELILNKKKKRRTKEKITELFNTDTETLPSSLQEVNVNNGPSGESNGLPAKKVQKMAVAVNIDCSNMPAEAPVSTKVVNTDCRMLAEAPISADVVNTDRTNMLAEASGSAEVVDTDRSNILSEATGSISEELIVNKKKKKRPKEKIIEVFNTDNEALASSLQEVNANNGTSGESNCLPAKKEKKMEKRRKHQKAEEIGYIDGNVEDAPIAVSEVPKMDIENKGEDSMAYNKQNMILNVESTSLYLSENQKDDKHTLKEEKIKLDKEGISCAVASLAVGSDLSREAAQQNTCHADDVLTAQLHAAGGSQAASVQATLEIVSGNTSVKFLGRELVMTEGNLESLKLHNQLHSTDAVTFGESGAIETQENKESVELRTTKLQRSCADEECEAASNGERGALSSLSPASSHENPEHHIVEAEAYVQEATLSATQDLSGDNSVMNGTVAMEDRRQPCLNVSSHISGVQVSKRKLLILDLNGLLADIVPHPDERYKHDFVLSKKYVHRRPHVDDFLEFCFERFAVAVWSSRTKRNIDPLIKFLFGPSQKKLLFRWDQYHCTKTGFNTIENSVKPLVFKELRKVWEKRYRDLPWKMGEYNESNTLLLDDSPYKALKNPANTAIFPNSYKYTWVLDNSLGPGGDLRVYLEGLALADNVQEYVRNNPFGQPPITESDPSWNYYSRVLNSCSRNREPRKSPRDDCARELPNDDAREFRRTSNSYSRHHADNDQEYARNNHSSQRPITESNPSGSYYRRDLNSFSQYRGARYLPHYDRARELPHDYAREPRRVMSSYPQYRGARYSPCGGGELRYHDARESRRFMDSHSRYRGPRTPHDDGSKELHNHDARETTSAVY